MNASIWGLPGSAVFTTISSSWRAFRPDWSASQDSRFPRSRSCSCRHRKESRSQQIRLPAVLPRYRPEFHPHSRCFSESRCTMQVAHIFAHQLFQHIIGFMQQLFQMRGAFLIDGPRRKREVSDAETGCQKDQKKDGNGGRQPLSAGNSSCAWDSCFSFAILLTSMSCSFQAQQAPRRRRKHDRAMCFYPAHLRLRIRRAFVRKQRCHLLFRCKAGHGNGVVIPERLPVPGNTGQGIAAACLFDLHGDR